MIDTAIETSKAYFLYRISLYLALLPVLLNNDTFSRALLSGFLGSSSLHQPSLTPPPQPLPPPYFSASPPRHLQSRLVSPPQSSPSHSMPGVGREAPESTMPRCASGEVCEEPAAAASSSSSPSSQAATDTQTGPAPRWIAPVNPTCLAAWSSPASTHLIKYTTLPLQAPEVLNLFTPPPTQPPPTPAGAPHITLPKNPQEGERIGGGFASPWAFLNNACFAPIATTTNKSNSHR